MSDYKPTTTEDVYSCFDYGYRNRSKVSFSATKEAFDRWFAGELEKARADEREKVKNDVSDACVAVQRRALNGEAVAMWEFASVVMYAAARGEDTK